MVGGYCHYLDKHESYQHKLSVMEQKCPFFLPGECHEIAVGVWVLVKCTVFILFLLLIIIISFNRFNL